MSLIGNHLRRDTMWKWLESQKSGWTEFYKFLEHSAAIARRAVTHESITTALADKDDKPVFILQQIASWKV